MVHVRTCGLLWSLLYCFEHTSPHSTPLHEILSCFAKAMHKFEVSFGKSMHWTRARGYIRLARTCTSWNTSHTFHALPHSTPRTFDEQHNGCQLRAEVMEGGNPYIWPCVIMNDSTIHSRGIARSRHQPSVALSNC